ncbi:trehalose 6-phosphate phosphorylase [Streptomyces carminius]|uniref:Trehalose 6-phosphate phosphorylase n=1 Tax=Streptomyces carminius TaxID=2665496 RepID=A0A2M8MBX1_9ACTN|nr:glycosyl hydrolase family 65 protein [Streptomyces carminius]PJE97871.1 trehalose 6-phosphate phosphorylase [Streptomyces carminius]PJF01698.1 trehalose 6-phosphate phosphorylase [Streptomyces carminius]
MERPEEQWEWGYEGYEPAEERLREALCTLGNGYLATRGAAPETDAGETHYPGTYVAGCYNRLVSEVAGRQVENEDMVNLPNWLPLRFRIPDGSDASPGAPWWTPDQDGLLEYRQVLDLRQGVLNRTLLLQDPRGRRLRVEQSRLVHMGQPHLAALRTTFTAENWTGTVEVESAIDGSVTNAGVARYRALNGRHLTGHTTGAAEPDTVWLRCHTTTSDICVALAARTRLAGTGSEGPEGPDGLVEAVTEPAGPRPARRLTLAVRPGEPVTVDKTVALHTSHDLAISDPLRAALADLADAPGFPELLGSHRAAWAELWRHADLEVPGKAGHILRVHLFHVLQTLSPHTADLDVGVPARGLHGEAYRGHIFWDELFVLPYLNVHFPETSRALLSYRHRRLPEAVRAAREKGYAGAMYPWQSGSDGREETQTLHLNPRSGRWLPDHSRLQHHVGSAIAYNVWQYCQASGDTDFLHTRGAETLLRIAQFWASRAEYDRGHERYRIRGVVGPDEYHEAYPGSDRPGLDDNAYTNVTAAWVLARALELLGTVPEPRRRELCEDLGIGEEDTGRWEDVSRRLRVPFHDGVISQFEGYGDLAELDWEGYRRKYGDIRRLDRIMEAEDDTVNRYKASKQADALMLGYLFSPAELAGLFRRLGHTLDDELWHRTVDYYLRRTSHGSTLSSLVHGWILARVRRPDAWGYVQEALVSDIADIQGGTTAEGIHLGAMAGTLDLVQRGLTGLETREDALWLDPVPVPELSEFGFTMRYRHHWGVAVRMLAGELCIGLPASAEGPVRVVLPDRTVTVDPGESCRLRLAGD